MRKKHLPPPYAVEHGFAVMDEKQSGLSQGLAALAPYSRASKAESPIERNIRVDSAIYTADIHEGGKYRFGDGTATAPPSLSPVPQRLASTVPPPTSSPPPSTASSNSP